jgi:hypothetical protein
MLAILATIAVMPRGPMKIVFIEDQTMVRDFPIWSMRIGIQPATSSARPTRRRELLVAAI